MKKTTTYRKPKQESLFEEEFTLEALSALGNPLEQVSALVDFELFRPTLEKTLLTEECKTLLAVSQLMLFLCSKSSFYNVIMVWVTIR